MIMKKTFTRGAFKSVRTENLEKAILSNKKLVEKFEEELANSIAIDEQKEKMENMIKDFSFEEIEALQEIINDRIEDVKGDPEDDFRV